MQQYKVINDQPIPEHLFFWRYSDYKQRTPSRSPLRKNKEPIKPTAQKHLEDELSECTFKPQTNNGRSWQCNEGDFIQRCQQFEEQRQAKLQRQRMCEVENELRECTFQPKISQFVRNANIINMSAKKQDEARQTTKNKEAKQMYRYADALNLLHKELHG